MSRRIKQTRTHTWIWRCSPVIGAWARLIKAWWDRVECARHCCRRWSIITRQVPRHACRAYRPTPRPGYYWSRHRRRHVRGHIVSHEWLKASRLDASTRRLVCRTPWSNLPLALKHWMMLWNYYNAAALPFFQSIISFVLLVLSIQRVFCIILKNIHCEP